MTSLDVGDTGVDHTSVEQRDADESSRSWSSVVEPATDGGAPSASLGPIAVLVAACAALVAGRAITDNSVLTHLATGRLLIDDGLPAANPFLYSSTDFPVPSWAWSLLLGATDAVGGATGVRLLVAVVAAALGAVLVLCCGPVDGRARLLEVVVPSGLALLCVLDLLGPRPHLLAFLLLASTVLVWSRGWNAAWLVPIFAVWVLAHGSWTFGVAVVVLLVVARWVDERRLAPTELALVGTAAAGVVLGAAAYPDRFALLWLPLRQFGDPIEREALQSYNEWARPGLGTMMLWPLVVLAVVALIGAWRGRRYGSLVAVVVLFGVGVSSVRMIPLAGIAVVPFAAAALRGVGSLRLPAGRSATALRVLAAGVGVLAVLGATGAFDPATAAGGYDLDPERFPVEAMDMLSEQGLIDGQVRIQTDVAGGNYASWRFGADAHVFVDDRPGAETLIDYRRMLRLEDGWQDAFARSDPDVVVWRGDLPFSDELAEDPEWRLAGEFGDHVVFCRTDIAPRCGLATS